MQVNFDKIISIGKTIYPEFRMRDAQDEELYTNLFQYFTPSEKGVLNKNKGILIMGSVGTGKTASMKVMGKMFAFKVIKTLHVRRECMVNAGAMMDSYGRKSFKTNYAGYPLPEQPITYCFDDLGEEPTDVNIYGTKSSIMEEILSDRYDAFIDNRMITHATSNKDGTGLQEKYGLRVRDRLREMMNIIDLNGKSKRK